MHRFNFPFRLRTFALAACLVPLLGSVRVCAQTTNSATSGNSPAVTQKKVADPKEITPVVAEQSPAASPFQFNMGIPAWSCGLDGTVGVKGVSGGVNVPFSSIWTRLNYIIPMTMDLRYQKWGFHLDGQLADLSETFNTRGALYLGGTVRMQQAFANFNVNYQVVDTDRWQLNTSLGGRYNYMSLSGNLNSRFPLVLPNLNMSGNVSWIDPVLGVDTTVQIFKPLSMHMLADVGGFGVGSHITYQFYGAPKVQLARNFYTEVGYRYLYTNYSENGNVYNIATKGPQITFGANF